MAFVVIGQERHALPIGDTLIGGPGGEGSLLPELGAAHASVAVAADGTATIQVIAGALVLVNGAPLGESPHPLRHGDRVDVGGIQIRYGDMSTTGSTGVLPGVVESEWAALAGIAGSTPTADTGGCLVRTADRASVRVPEEGLVIGRDPACDVVLRDKGTSRRHATIRPSIQGYVIADHSTNGVLVNGRKIDGMHVLGMGDVVRIGDDEFRFEADEASFEPAAELLEAAPGVPPSSSGNASPDPSSLAARESPPVPPTVERSKGSEAPLLATLEIMNEGVHKGARFRIHRAITHVGRRAENDVKLDDDSVSGSHAVLIRRGDGWSVTDLDSTNGTYLDGERIRGERALATACELRFGGIKVVFRAIAASSPDSSSTRVIVGAQDPGAGSDS